MKRAGYRKTWIAAAFLSFVFTALMILSAFMPMFSTAYAEEDEHVETVTVDDAKAYILNDAVRIMPLSDGIVRLEEKAPDGFENRDTYYVLGRRAFMAPASEHTVTATELVVTTARYIVHIPIEATDLTGAYVTDAKNTTLYRYNGVTLPNTYLPSPSEDARGWYFSDNPRIVPGDRGYSIHNDGLELNGWDFDNEAPDVYVFVPESYTEFCEDYVTLTGKSNLVDLKTLGYWDSRWYIYNSDLALQQVQEYLDRGYSIDVLVIDTNWRAGAVNEPGSSVEPSTGGMGYEIDKNLFPNMAETLQKLHDMGVNIIFNDHPEPKAGTTNGLDDAEIEYRSKSLKGILSFGLDMWWYDRNWHTALNSADRDLSVYAWGMYAFQFIENEYYESLVSDEEALQEYARRAIIMGNVDGCENGYWKYGSDLTAHRYTIQWTGDIGVDEAALGREISNAVFAGVESGIPYVSSDLGGHTAAVTDDMYARWLQYGALSTITRVHCTHVYYCHQEGRMPWLFGETAENVTKEYVGMKYNLMPLYYSLAGENARTGLPIMRRLDVKYPQYAEASRNDEYLLGDGILIAPINEAQSKPAIPENFFTYTDAKGTRNGLLGSYYNNTSANGTPAYTQMDEQFVFDWGQAGPLDLSTNNFSIRWEGKFKVGNSDTCLTFFADDRVQVRIDGTTVVNSYDEASNTNDYDKLFETDYYKAGTEHTIEIKYVEEGNYAHFYMYCIEKPAQGASICYDTRDVFFPDGTWVDVWSGKEYEGPYTYSVTYPLETSPVFVRKGALNVLAPDMSNLSEKDWSELTLDAYPSASRAETSLYEDDTTTQAYKYGHYRTTAISAGAADGKYTITIGAAVGKFTGKKAFTERKWNIRLHAFEELGEVTGVTVNGKPVSGMSYFSRDSLASPFSFTGASADTAVYMFSFTGSVTEETVIVIDFENNAKLTAFGKNAQYDATAANFDVSVADNVEGWINLDNEDYEDWAYFGNITSRKGGAKHVIGDISSDFELWSGSTAAICADWTNGEGRDSGDGISVGVAAQVYEDVTLQVKAGGEKVYTLYLMSYRCIGKLTIRDREGHVQTILLDEPIKGLSSSGDLNNNLSGRSVRKVTITVSAETDTEIYIHYGMHSVRPSGAASDARVGITAIVYGDAAAVDSAKPDVAQAAITRETVPPQVNLSEYAGGGVLDWYKSNYGAAHEVYKEGGDAIRSVDFTQQKSFGDYKSSISWTDGENGENCTGTSNGYHTESNGNICILVNVDADTKYIVLYVGAWRGSTQVTLQNYKGEARGSVSFSAGEDSVCNKVVIPISVEEATRVTVLISSSATGTDGNASLAALQVVGS